MSNVISQDARKTVSRMYRSRFMIAGSLAGIACSVLSALALLPSYLTLRAADATASPSAGGALSDTDRAALAQLQGQLQILRPLFATTSSPVALLSSTLARRGAGVRIMHITYTSGTPSTFTFAGEATPSALDTYRKTLVDAKLFESVSVPVNDLISAQGGAFSMKLSGTF